MAIDERRRVVTMTWAETHRRWAALREAEAELVARPGRVPWRPEYAALFGTEQELLAALRYRWRLRLQAQLDPELEPDVQAELLARLRASLPAVEDAEPVPA